MTIRFSELVDNQVQHFRPYRVHFLRQQEEDAFIRLHHSRVGRFRAPEKGSPMHPAQSRPADKTTMRADAVALTILRRSSLYVTPRVVAAESDMVAAAVIVLERIGVSGVNCTP
jgi:hypothetical protein